MKVWQGTVSFIPFLFYQLIQKPHKKKVNLGRKQPFKKSRGIYKCVDFILFFLQFEIFTTQKQHFLYE